jgi:AhpD family alkylhydroperoxidase
MVETIRLVSEEEASPEVNAIYQDVKKHYNLEFVPNAMKALAHDPVALKQAWEGLVQLEEYWGLEMATVIALAVDVTNGCQYCINFETALLKEMGYSDEKIHNLVSFIAQESFFNRYVEGLGLEPDVTPAMMERKKAA